MQMFVCVCVCVNTKEFIKRCLLEKSPERITSTTTSTRITVTFTTIRRRIRIAATVMMRLDVVRTTPIIVNFTFVR